MICSKKTHTHPVADAAALAATDAVRRAFFNDPLETWIPGLRDLTKGISPEFSEALVRLEIALGIKETHPAVAEVCRNHGGWTAEEVLGTALLSIMRHPDDFSKAILLSVNTGGDSDSIGCVAGAIQGARLGISAIPAEWINGIERREDLESLADRMWTGAKI